jgi:serine protease Do
MSLRASLVGVATCIATSAFASVPLDGYADLVEKVSPTVVTVLVTGEAPERRAALGGSDDLPFGTPFDELFRRFGVPAPGSRGEAAPQRGLGSGFILDAAGYIVTNDHVVQNAAAIKVRLADDTELDARLVGADPKTDLALLKVDADRPLPQVVLGDSDRTRVGEAVIAVGNPFGLGDTVTSGIISARGRDIDSGPYVDYFQTDAAINRGNSGGPLFNARGEVIGVNTAIFSPNGGSVGVGFAIPSNVVGQVAGALKEHGAVARGWLGVTIQPLTRELAEATGVDGTKGALVADVAAKSPADGKLQPGDVIVGFAGKPVESVRDLPKLVAATPAGEQVRVDFHRDGTRRSVDVVVVDLDDPGATLARADLRGDRKEGGSAKLGATVAPLSAVARRQLGLDEDVQGVVITSVERDGAAARAGLRAGDVIDRVSGREVRSVADLEAGLESTHTPSALLRVNRRGAQSFVGVRLG